MRVRCGPWSRERRGGESSDGSRQTTVFAAGGGEPARPSESNVAVTVASQQAETSLRCCPDPSANAQQVAERPPTCWLRPRSEPLTRSRDAYAVRGRRHRLLLRHLTATCVFRGTCGGTRSIRRLPRQIIQRPSPVRGRNDSSQSGCHCLRFHAPRQLRLVPSTTSNQQSSNVDHLVSMSPPWRSGRAPQRSGCRQSRFPRHRTPNGSE